ncbi:MAG: DUF2513 domain-containing protein [Oscillospiraceae bacterium]
MNLNYDCVRDLLLCLEENLTCETEIVSQKVRFNTISLNTVCNSLPNYTREDVTYTAVKLKEANFIEMQVIGNPSHISSISFESITFSGHQYLDSIKSSSVWEEVKQTFKSKAIELSLNAIMIVAKNVISKQLAI